MPARAEQGAGPFVPDDRTLSVLQEAVALYLNRGFSANRTISDT
jgi:hypothetical protein